MSEFIVFEGLDGSGKETQSKLALEYLRSKGYKVERFSFPNYDNEISSYLVKKYLAGEIYKDGIPDENTSAFLFTLDRKLTFDTDEKFKRMLEENDIIILDRYVGSNIICHANSTDIKANFTFAKWILEMEHKTFEIPVPDHIIILDLDPEISHKLLVKRREATGEKEDYLDDLEKQKAMLKGIDCMNLTYGSFYPNVTKDYIVCAERMEVLTIEEISNKVKFVLDKYYRI